MWDKLIAIIIACVSSTGLYTLIQFLVQRKDNKNDKINKLSTMMDDLHSEVANLGNSLEEYQKETKDLKDLFSSDREVYMKESNEQKKDLLRVQLLLMIDSHPTNKDNILQLAEKYFVECGGNWYMRDVFMQWADKYNVNVPFDVM